MVAVANRLAPAEEQALLQLHQHLDSTEAEVQAFKGRPQEWHWQEKWY
jgi:hypothetical protein